MERIVGVEDLDIEERFEAVRGLRVEALRRGKELQIIYNRGPTYWFVDKKREDTELDIKWAGKKVDFDDMIEDSDDDKPENLFQEDMVLSEVGLDSDIVSLNENDVLLPLQESTENVVLALDVEYDMCNDLVSEVALVNIDCNVVENVVYDVPVAKKDFVCSDDYGRISERLGSNTMLVGWDIGNDFKILNIETKNVMDLSKMFVRDFRIKFRLWDIYGLLFGKKNKKKKKHRAVDDATHTMEILRWFLYYSTDNYPVFLDTRFVQLYDKIISGCSEDGFLRIDELFSAYGYDKIFFLDEFRGCLGYIGYSSFKSYLSYRALGSCDLLVQIRPRIKYCYPVTIGDSFKTKVDALRWYIDKYHHAILYYFVDWKIRRKNVTNKENRRRCVDPDVIRDFKKYIKKILIIVDYFVLMFRLSYIVLPSYCEFLYKFDLFVQKYYSLCPFGKYADLDVDSIDKKDWSYLIGIYNKVCGIVRCRSFCPEDLGYVKEGEVYNCYKTRVSCIEVHRHVPGVKISCLERSDVEGIRVKAGRGSPGYSYELDGVFVL